MRTTVAIAAFLAAASSSLTAQVRKDAVTCRIDANHYGARPEVPAPPQIDLVVRDKSAAIVASSPMPGLGLVVLGARKAEAVVGPSATLLVQPQHLVHATFGARGQITLPIDLCEKGLIGKTVFAQAFRFDGVELQSSLGLGMRFAAGNKQPAHGLPPVGMSAVYIRNNGRQGVRVAMKLPTAGHKLVRDGMRQVGDRTQLLLSIQEPKGATIPVIRTVQKLLPLPNETSRTIDVMIRTVPARDTTGKPIPYRLAVRIESGF